MEIVQGKGMRWQECEQIEQEYLMAEINISALLIATS